jgi:hypothetical protein
VYDARRAAQDDGEAIYGDALMAIDYSLLPFSKSRPKALDKQDKAAALATLDKAESAKAKARAKGRCEVVEATPNAWNPSRSFSLSRCPRKDSHTHHLLSGIGRKNIGRSILASAKIRVCQQCHADIHAKVLQPTTDTTEAAKVRYRRSR